MRLTLRTGVAGALLVALLVLAGCGDRSQLLPPQNARSMKLALSDVRSAVSKRDCPQIAGAVGQVRAQVGALPSSVSKDLVTNINENLTRLNDQATQECAGAKPSKPSKPSKPKTTDSTQTDTTPTQTDTTPTDTTPTQTDTTPTDTTPTQTAPPQTTPKDSGGSGSTGKDKGNGNGNGNGAKKGGGDSGGVPAPSGTATPPSGGAAVPAPDEALTPP